MHVRHNCLSIDSINHPNPANSQPKQSHTLLTTHTHLYHYLNVCAFFVFSLFIQKKTLNILFCVENKITVNKRPSVGSHKCLAVVRKSSTRQQRIYSRFDRKLQFFIKFFFRLQHNFFFHEIVGKFLTSFWWLLVVFN